MNFDFPTILTLITLFAGVVAITDMFYCRARKKAGFAIDSKAKKPVLIDYCRSFFPVLLLVLIIRSFIIQPYRVPTGSLEPTVIPGDLILVNQYKYGLRLPAWNKKVVTIAEPKRGQIALFHWPVNPKATFVKRVIGVPGDKISYINKVFYINGKQATQKLLGYAKDNSGRSSSGWRVAIYEENLLGTKHKIYVCPKGATDCPNSTTHDFYNLVVPKGMYFMVGDNRDNSDDSRDWGFVAEKDFIGKAFLIWMSWDSNASLLHKIRWRRIGIRL